MRHLPKTEYTAEDQRRDTNWLMGVRYGRNQTHAEWEAKVRRYAKETEDSHILSLLDEENGNRLLAEWLDERLAPIVEVQQDWKKNFYSAFAKRLGRAIGKARL